MPRTGSSSSDLTFLIHHASTDHHALPSPPQSSRSPCSNGRSASFSRPYHHREDLVESRNPHVSNDSPHRASLDHPHLQSRQIAFHCQSRYNPASTTASASGSLPSLPQASIPKIASLTHENSNQVDDNSFRRFSQIPMHQSNSQVHQNHHSGMIPSQMNLGSWRTSFKQQPQLLSDTLGSDSSTSSMWPPDPSPRAALSPGSRPSGNEATDYFDSSDPMSSAGSAPTPLVRESGESHSSSSDSKALRERLEGSDKGSEGQDLQLRKRLRISRACNECRRRKTKCNIVGAFRGETAFEEASEELQAEANSNDWGMIILKPCTNCQRSGIKCAYTKRSVKRGPAKGYIKELEKRLDHLETVALPSAAAGPSTSEPRSGPSYSDPEATEDRISRLEQVLADSDRLSDSPITSAVENPKLSHQSAAVFDRPKSANSDRKRHHSSECQGAKRSRDEKGDTAEAISQESHAVFNSVTTDSRSHSHNVSLSSNSNLRFRPVETASSIKRSYLSTSIQATFPVVYSDPVEAARSLMGLDERPILRGMKLILDPIERPTADQPDARSRSVSRSESPFFNSPLNVASGPKVKSQPSKQISLFAQASAGFSKESTGSFASMNSSHCKKETLQTGAIRAGRKLSHMKAAMEADSLLFCYLDSLRRGQENQSALAVAVSKLGGLRSLAMGDDLEPATRRRRTVMMMMDRWHSLAFNTAPLLTGRLALEEQPLSTLVSSLGSPGGSNLGEAVNEVLRTARMFSQLQDFVGHYGWKSVTETELTAIFERNNDDSVQDSIHQSSLSAFPPLQFEVDVSSILAFRMSLVGCIRTFHKLNVLASSSHINIKEISSLFDLTKSIVVLGTAQRGLSKDSILLKTLIGPHIFSIAIASFCLVLRALTLFVKRTESLSKESGLVARVSKDELQMLEHYRRKSTDYLRLIAMLIPFCGGESLNSHGSFQPLSIKLQLFCHSNLNYSNSLGDLVKFQSLSQTPLGQSESEICREYDDFLELIRDCGPLGFILSSTDDDAVWNSSPESLQFQGVGFEALT